MRFLYLFLIVYGALMVLPRIYYYLLLATVLLVLMGFTMKTRTRSLELIVRTLGGHAYDAWHPKNKLLFIMFITAGLILELFPIRSSNSLIPIPETAAKYFHWPNPIIIFFEAITISAGLKFAGNRLANYLPYFITRKHKKRHSRRHGKRRSRSTTD